MGSLNPTLEALARTLGRAASGERQPATPVPLRPETSESGGDLVALHLQLTTILVMPLNQFAREGQLLEVRVLWLAETLWFVPDEGDAEVLGRDGVRRGRVWTARELMAVMALDRRTVPVRVLALAKCAADGDIVDVRPPPLRG